MALLGELGVPAQEVRREHGGLLAGADADHGDVRVSAVVGLADVSGGELRGLVLLLLRGLRSDPHKQLGVRVQ